MGFLYMWIKFGFSPVSLPYVGFIIRPAQEATREERERFPPLHYFFAIDFYFYPILFGIWGIEESDSLYL